MAAKHPYFIVNPQAGSGRSERLWPEIAAKVEALWGTCDFIFTRKEGDATRYAKLACEKGKSWVVAVGGDGTVHEVVNGLMQADAKGNAVLGIISMGSGDDFVKTLGLPKDPFEALEVLREKKSQAIDLIQVSYVNHDGKRESRYCMNLADFGLGGKVMQKVNASSKRFGSKLTYLFHSIATFLTFNSFSAVLESEERNYHFHYLIMGLVANGKFFGSGMCVVPEAEVGDGWMNVVLVEKMNIATFLKMVPQIYSREKVENKSIFRMKAKRLHVQPTSEKPVYIELDGEQPGTLPATFELVPRALRICMLPDAKNG